MSLTLTVPRQDFLNKLASRIAEGHIIIIDFVRSIDDASFINVEQDYAKWNDYNRDLLESCFNEIPNKYTDGYQNTADSTFDEMLAIANNIDTRNTSFRRSHFRQNIQPKIDYLDNLSSRVEFIPYEAPISPGVSSASTITLTHLHPTVQQVAGPLWASSHYRQAVLDTCIALDKAVQDKANLPATTIGVSLMTTAFSANQPLIRLSLDRNEQTGFMNLYQGSVQAIRNHYGHNLTEIPAPRALEWLSFISALFYKLD